MKNIMMKKMRLIIAVLLLLIIGEANSQSVNVDGVFDEEIWSNAVEFTNFKTYQPDIGLEASEKTRVLLSYDSSNVYFAVYCFDSDPSLIRATLTSRDNLKNEDAFSIEFGVKGNANSNLFFRCNPLGIQEDGIINQAEGEDLNPDKIWYSKGQITDKGYQLEIRIPFSSLRYKWRPNVQMDIGFTRKIFRKSELVVFPEFKEEISNRLMQRQDVSFTNIEKNKVLEIIPSLTYTYDRKLNEGNWNTQQNKFDAGITGKIGLTSDLVLDMTINPDFSQIESDAGQIDFNRRNPIYYAEKRPFFQEGVEMFDFGGQNMWNMPLEYIVNTRQIVDPIYGIKLSGKLSNKLSVASIISSDDQSSITDHYQILRLKRSFKGDNFIGITYTGKENKYNSNRVGGIDGSIRLSGKTKIEYYFYSSFTDNDENYTAANSFGSYFEYKNRIHTFKFGYFQTDEDFNTEIGYTNRTGVQLFPIFYYANFPIKSKTLTKIRYILNSRPSYDMVSNETENSTYTGLEFHFKNDSWIWFGKFYSTENFQNIKFKNGDFSGGYYFQLNKYFYITGSVGHGNKIYYDEANPYQGYGWNTSHSVLFTPTSQLKFKLSGNYANFHRKSDKKFIYDYKIMRLHSTYQLNDKLFFRAIGEYNYYKKQFNSEFLISFTYIPGTVLQLGYNMRAERNLPDASQRINEDLQLNQKMLFFKASFLFN